MLREAGSDAGAGGEVDHDVEGAALEQVLDETIVPDIPFHQLIIRPIQKASDVGPLASRIVEVIEIVEDGYAVAALEKPP